MKSTLISVIVPVHNRANKIMRCIDSVMNQTYSQLELIVVDDASSDETSSVVSSLAINDQRIKLIKLEKKMGAQHARNVGIKNSKGEWITFLDSDDYYLKDSIENRFMYAQKNNLDVVHSDCFVISNDNAEKLYGVKPIQGNVYEFLLAKPAPVFPALMVKKTALEKIGNLDEGIISYQEWDTCIRLARYFEFGFVEAPSFVYDCCDTDTISSDFKRDADGYCQIFNKHREQIKLHVGAIGIANHYDFIGRRYKRAGNYLIAAKYIFISKFYSIWA